MAITLYVWLAKTLEERERVAGFESCYRLAIVAKVADLRDRQRQQFVLMQPAIQE